MSTRDQFTFGRVSYPISYTSPQYVSEYPPVVDERSIGACPQNYDFIYEEPPPAPFLEAAAAISPSPSPSPSPSYSTPTSKYRAIWPRPNEYDPKTRNPGDALRLKPRKR
ncbi:uncharacterized protein N7506_005641 [Penicillium brevicompactum]|uniref:uncharacterized protein n=1 Tax=Penicillium brevicompactum TaxID=5074 RepID=UPI002540F7A5|nr:uncharacterized protein N7506_005641 [Penicillium brevicompactum]KAJ5335705.1 hypothetical protein N7506_005641 [Penicillium brevicompactum]